MTPREIIDSLLNAFWAGDGAGVAQQVTGDFTLLNVAFPTKPLQGRAALRAMVEQGNSGFPGPVTDARHEILHSFGEGAQVMHERIDFWTYRGCQMQMEVASFWELRDNQVHLWKDYFDFGSYVRQMRAAGEHIDRSHFGLSEL